MAIQLPDHRQEAADHAAGAAQGSPEETVRTLLTLPREVVADLLARTAGPNDYAGLAALADAIAQSESILSLPDNWDEQGAHGYQRDTWLRAMEFLWTLAVGMKQLYGLTIDVPHIAPSIDGSIDLHWKTERFELLVNVPAEADGAVRFYGDNLQGLMPLEGSCPAGEPDRKLVAWLSLMK